MEQRRNPRFRTRFDALYSAGREEGAGILADLSRSGALIEDSSLQPPIGTKLRLYVFVQPVQPFEILGVVVRHTEHGFAIEQIEIGDEVERLVDDVAALVSAPR